MLLGLTTSELELIRAYRCAADRDPLIRRYAMLNHLSLGRAEDALDLWVHLLEPPIRRAAVPPPGAEAA